MKHLPRVIALSLAELRLALLKLSTKIQNESPQNDISPLAARRQHLAACRILLQELLRRVPFWTRGHIEYGLTLFELEVLRDGKKDPRAIAGIRASRDAAIMLGVDPKRDARLQFLRGAECFFLGDYEQAFLEFEQAGQHGIKQRTQLLALEYAGAAAMALGRETQALALYQSIPLNAQSGEIKIAISYLEDPERRMKL